MPEAIQVQWRIEAGQTKGTILRDANGRRKIVFVDRGYRGRPPKHGEITEARVWEETKPEDPHSGVLKVHPIFPPDPTALPEDEAKAKMLQMIRKEGVVLGERWIEVNLPGWTGDLHGVRARGPYNGSVSMCWRFNSASGSRWMTIDDGTSDHGHTPITTAIVSRRFELHVVDCPRALRELGQPVSVETVGRNARATWQDERGKQLIAEVSELQAFGCGGRIENVRLSTYGRVVGRIVMLDGAWVEEEADFASRELCSDGRSVRRAQFEERYAPYLRTFPDIRAQVVQILRPSLHSVAWHQQESLARVLSREATWETAIWKKVQVLRGLLNDRFTPIEVCRRALESLRRIRADIANAATMPWCLVGHADPEIYGAGIIDDSQAVVQRTAENLEMMQSVDAEIATMEAEMERQSARQADPDLIEDAWAELVVMSEHIEAYLAACEKDQPDKIEEIRRKTRWVSEAVHSAIQIVETAHNSIAHKLEAFRCARERFTERFPAEAVQAQSA